MKIWSRNARIALAAIGCATLHLYVGATDLTASQAVQVTSITGSKSSTNGFFLFTGNVAVTGCEAGFWLPASDSAYGASLAIVNSALATRSAVRVVADRNQRWSGSGDNTCRVTQLQAV